MLSLQPLKSARGAAEYYTSAFNYYSGDSQAMKWFGEGAKQLGLSQEVNKQQMIELLSGLLPDGTQLINKGNGKHRPGFDMTFSAPKSVSVLIGLNADKRLEKLHDSAVEKALTLIEKEFAETRININGTIEFHKTGNFTIALFRQPSSRANDPDTHTHCVVMNMTFDKNGKARSLASDPTADRGVVEQIQRAIKYAGLLYRTELANELKALGYKLESRGEGLFEIAGMPEEVLKEFSKRREEIEAEMVDRNWQGAKAASAVARLTRNDKEEYDIDVLKTDWQKRAKVLDFDAEAFVKEATSLEEKPFLQSLKESLLLEIYGIKELPKQFAKEAVEAGIEIISQKTSVFSRRDLMEFALKHTLLIDEKVDIRAINQVIDTKIQAQTLYQGKDPYSDKDMLTTPWQLTLETETLARIENNKGIMKAITSKRQVNEHLKMHNHSAKFQLTPSQSSAISEFLTCKDRFMAIQGFAGTGKTTMLQLAQFVANEQGYVFRGITVNSSAANELSQKAGIKTDVFPLVYNEIRSARGDSLKNSVYIVDEASMLSSPQGHALIKLIEKKGARLYLVGDDAQLLSVKNGRIFGLSQEYGIKTTILSDMIRQKSEGLREAVGHAIKAEIYDAVMKTSEVRSYDTYDERIKQFATSYLNLSPEVRLNTLLFAPTHKNRNDITNLIRMALVEEGQLGSNEIEHNILIAKPMEAKQWHHARYYSRNDVIRFNIDIPRYGISKGDYLTVGSVKREQVVNETLLLTKENGKCINFKLSTLPEYNEHKAGLDRYVEVYQKKELNLRENDKLLWTKNFKKEGIANSETATLITIKKDKFTIRLSDGMIKEIERSNPILKHLDHGHVLTNYKVQGKDKFYGIGFIESYNKHSATLRNYYVQISRGIYSIKIITDDKNQLMRALSLNLDEKKSALDHLSKTQLQNHQNKFADNQQRLDLTTVFDKKETKEAEWVKIENKIYEYQQSKEQNHTALSAKIAHEIIHHPKMYRLAKTRLSHGESIYRNDALKLDHLNYMKMLNSEDKKNFLLVKNYVNTVVQSRDAFKKPTAKISTHLNFKKAIELSDKRNALAFEMTTNIDKYKNHLQQFSMGKENRLGLSAHRIEGEAKLAMIRLDDLLHYTKKHQIRADVETYFQKDCDKNEQALLLQNQAKAAHRHIIREAEKQKVSPHILWKNINRDAQIAMDNRFKNKLSLEDKPLFELAKTYKALGLEMKGLFTNKALMSEDNYFKVLNDLKNKRIQIGSKLINTPDKERIYHYLNIKTESLERDQEQKQVQENVKTLLNPVAGLKAKLDAAYEMAMDLKGHYPQVKALGLSSKTLSRYLVCAQRKDYIEALSENEKKDYLSVLSYKSLSRQSIQSWKSLYELKAKGIDVTATILNKAVSLSSQRDRVANLIYHNDENRQFIDKENIKIESVKKHAEIHLSKVETIKSLNDEKASLLERLSQSQGQMPPQERNYWVKDWKENNHQQSLIEGSKSAYQDALDSSDVKTDKRHKEIIDKFELTNLNQKTATSVYFVKKQIDLSQTVDTLMANPKETYLAIFGQPKAMNNKTMKFSGGIHVTLTGSKAGLWYNFVTGEGGSPIEAIMHTRNVDFKEALSIASSLSGADAYASINLVRKDKNQIKLEEKQETINKIKSAKSIMRSCVDIKGTLAEKYLRDHRKIGYIDSLNVKFWPKNSPWLNLNNEGKLIENVNKIPALIIPATNKKGEIVGVQRIYLDEKTGTKNTFMTDPKLSKGLIEGSAGVIQEGNSGKLYIAEGPETAITIANADKKSTVITSFGLGNMGNLKTIIKSLNPSEIIIAGDNDSNKNIKIKTMEIVNDFSNEGFKVMAIFPKRIEGQDKTDWNDVLQKFGLDEVKKQMNESKFEQEINPKNLAVFDEPSKNIESFYADENRVENINKIDIHQQTMNQFDTKTLKIIESKLDDINCINKSPEKEKTKQELNIDL